PRLLIVSDIVQDGGVAIFSVERPAHERPEHARDRSAIDNRSRRRDPDNAIGIGVMQFAQERHMPTIVFPPRFDLSTVITPRMFWPYCRGVPRRRLMAAARVRSEREEDVIWSHPARKRSPYACWEAGLRVRR